MPSTPPTTSASSPTTAEQVIASSRPQRRLYLALAVLFIALLYARFRPLGVSEKKPLPHPEALRNLTMPMKITPRLSQDRGHADHGWLKTFHTFSFAMYQDFDHSSFGCLCVINEDRVAPKEGFGTHAHREFEIFSYIVDGELEQYVLSIKYETICLKIALGNRDSMGNMEVLKRGDLQMTSAGTGIRHSEYQHGSKPVHFLQIWSLPHTRALPPRYTTRRFTDKEKQDRWARIVAPAGSAGVSDAREAEGPAPVHSALELRATILNPGTRLAHTFPESKGPRKAYVHVIQCSGYNPKAAMGASVKIAGDGAETVLREGDGAYIIGEPGKEMSVENVGDIAAEVLLFDVDV